MATHEPSANGAEIGNEMTKNQTMSPKAATNNNKREREREREREIVTEREYPNAFVRY